MRSLLLGLICLSSLVCPLSANQSCSSEVSDSAAYISIPASDSDPNTPSVPNPYRPGSVLITDGQYISRVVGPGTPDTFNDDGTLKYWDDYTARNIVSSTASVSMAFQLPEEPNVSVTGTLYVNGYPEKTLSFSDGNYKCVEISTRHLKFATRGAMNTVGSDDWNEYSGNNYFELRNVSGTCRSYDGTPYACGIDEAPVWATSINFQALAPVVLLHGIRSDYHVFDTIVAQLQSAGIPCVAIDFDENLPLGSVNIRQKIIDAAADFGARHVHIVAHSKGGLWARAFLTRLPSNFGAYSLTTLSTPHRGTVAAEIGLASARAPLFSTYDPNGICLPYSFG